MTNRYEYAQFVTPIAEVDGWSRPRGRYGCIAVRELSRRAGPAHTGRRVEARRHQTRREDATARAFMSL
jgi:hypothetical protein